MADEARSLKAYGELPESSACPVAPQREGAAPLFSPLGFGGKGPRRAAALAQHAPETLYRLLLALGGRCRLLLRCLRVCLRSSDALLLCSLQSASTRRILSTRSAARTTTSLTSTTWRRSERRRRGRSLRGAAAAAAAPRLAPRQALNTDCNRGGITARRRAAERARRSPPPRSDVRHHRRRRALAAPTRRVSMHTHAITAHTRPPSAAPASSSFDTHARSSQRRSLLVRSSPIAVHERCGSPSAASRAPSLRLRAARPPQPQRLRDSRRRQDGGRALRH